jgi:Lon protease-like protein
MPDEMSVHVNFARPVPLFPLDGVVVLPQHVVPLHIFEPRYRQMLEHVLDGAGQIAMAVLAEPDRSGPPGSLPRIRPAVCLGQVVRHERLPDGRFNILLQGICRARILEEQPPAADRMYRTATLEPVGLDSPTPSQLTVVRSQIERLLGGRGLGSMAAATPALEWVADEDLSDQLVLELMTLTMIAEPKLRYKLLAEPDAATRASMVLAELRHLDRMITAARGQHPERWPKGMSWN